ASTADLREARDGLVQAIERAKLEHNPLFVDFDDEAPAPAASVSDLEKKLADAKGKRRSEGFVSDDGKLQLIVARPPFEPGADRSAAVVAAAERAAAATRAELGPAVEIGLTGDIVVGLAEHDALVDGMLRAAILTCAIVALALVMYYRSVRAVAALLGALAVGTALTFAFTKLAIGHLNVATAFLSSIVVGNGINFGILVVARYLEEKRRGLAGVAVIAAAMRGTVTGTLAAALTATVAYAWLLPPGFKGFRHFGPTGGVGMVLCWIASYSVLPAFLAVLERRGFRAPRAPALGGVLGHLAPRSRLGVVALATFAFSLTAA